MKARVEKLNFNLIF